MIGEKRRITDSEITDYLLPRDKTFATLTVDAACCKPAAAQFIVQIIGDLGLQSNAGDTPARSMGVPSTSAQPLECGLQQTDCVVRILLGPSRKQQLVT